MNKQETELIVRAIDVKTGGIESECEEIANAFRNLRTVLFDCFKSEYKPGVAILLDYLKSSDCSSSQLTAAVAILGEYRKSEIITTARRLLLLTSSHS